MCNPFYTAYHTLPTKDRLALVEVLLAGYPVKFRLDEQALSLALQFGLAPKWLKRLKLAAVPGAEWTGSEFEQFLKVKEKLPGLEPKRGKVVKDALAYYRAKS